MTALFLSHSSHDNEIAAQVRQRLRDEGYQATFLDVDPEDGIAGGSDWERELYLQVRKADAVVFLASAESVVSRWCFAEITLARLLGRPVFPVRVEDQARLELLRERQWVDLAEGPGAYTRLFEGLRLAGLSPADSFGWDQTRSPYPGLQAFDAQDAAVFFGRGDDIDKLMQYLSSSVEGWVGRFVAIAGPSGSGKSSLLRAGVLPRLARLAQDWVILPAMVPGSDPFEALALRLAETIGAVAGRGAVPQKIADDLRSAGSPALVRLARDLGGAGGSRRKVLVVLDQAEELVTRTGPAQQQEFLSLLRGALTEDSPLWVVATLRSEFLSSAPDRAGLAEVITHTVLVEPLSRARLPEVIERPGRQAGLTFEEGLVGRMVEETVGGDALPLLAYTLQQLYLRTGRHGRVTSEEYERLGGVVGALRGLADEVTDGLALDGRKDWVLPTLLKLASVDETGQPTRRRVRQATLAAEEQVVVQAFTKARLLTTRGREGADATVEVAHEALLRQWPPLRQEVDRAHQDLRLRSDLERLAGDWERSDHDESYLLRGGGRLDALRGWVDRHSGELGDDDAEISFLRASGALERTELEIARERQRVNAGRSLLYQAESLRTSQAGLSLLLGVAAMRVDPSPEARRSLISTLLGNHYLATTHGHDSEISAVTFRPDGRIMATGGMNPSVVLWDVSDPAHPSEVSRIDAHTDGMWALQFSADGRTLVTGGPDSRIMLWDVGEPATPRRLSLRSEGPRWISSAAFSPDGRLLLTGVWDNSGGRGDKAILWVVSERSHPRAVATLTGPRGWTGPVRTVAIGADGRTAFTGNDDSTVIVWDISDPDHCHPLTVLEDHANSVWAVAVSPDGVTLVTAGADQTAIVWDVSQPAAPRRLSTLTGHSGTVRAVAFAADGSTVTTGSWDHTATVWSLEDRALPVRKQTLGGHSQAVFALACHPDGHTVATASSDHTTVVWDTSPPAQPRQLARLEGHTDEIAEVVFAPDGRTLATGSLDHTAALWDVADPRRPRRLAVLSDHGDTVFTAAFAADGRRLLTAGDDGNLILWDVADPRHPRKLSTLPAHDGPVASVGFSPDGRTVASGGNDATVVLWDITDPARPQSLITLAEHESWVRGVPFSPHGGILVTSSTDGTTIVWDVSHPAKPVPLATLEDENSTYQARFSPDGHVLVLAQEGRKTTLWDLSDPRQPDWLATMRGHASSVYTAAFDPAGRMLATGGYDKTTILWDVSDLRHPRELITLAGNPRGVAAVEFSPHQPVLAIAAGNAPGLWDVARLTDIVLRPEDVASSISGRELTEKEWETFAPGLSYEDRR